MKIFTNKKIVQKIVIILIALILFNFTMPVRSRAAITFADIGGDLLKELVQLVAAVGDVVMGGLNSFMLGTSGITSSVMLEKNNINLTDERSTLYDDGNADHKVEVKESKLDGLLFSEWKIPNMLYCPEAIFSNRIAMLDVNFLRKHKYTAVQYNKDDIAGKQELKNEDATGKSKKRAQSLAGNAEISKTIAGWYQGLRNIAVVGLLIVLVYLGIRILISSTAVDKAKYKEMIQDWLVALCLVVAIHLIMSMILMFSDQLTSLFDDTANKTIGVTVTSSEQGGSDLSFKTNFMGYIRFMSQNEAWGECTAYTIMYLALVIYTLMFTVTYLKRFLYMAFFTMIAPLVALTYPIDKVKDGKAQAFNMLIREYAGNALIQPVHLIIYSVFIGGAIVVAVSNPIYGIISIAFLIPAEKFIKKMFGLDKGETSPGLGTIAGGALAMKGVGALVGHLKGGNKNGGNANQGGNTEENLGSRGKSPGAKIYNNPLDVLAGRQNQSGGSAGAGGSEGTQANQNPENINGNQRNSDGTFGGNTENEQEQRTPILGPDGNPVDAAGNPILPERPILGPDGNPIDSAGNPILPERPILGPDGHPINPDGSPISPNEDPINSNDEALGETEPQTLAGGNATRDPQDIINDLVGNTGVANGTSGQSQQEEEQVPQRTRGERFTRGMGAVFGHQKRKIQRAMSPENIKNKLVQGSKGALKMTARAAGTATAGAALGTVAAGAAVASGDLTKGASIMAGAAGMSVGVGKTIGDRISSGASKATEGVVDAYKSGAYTKDEQKVQKQKKADKAWKKDEKNYKYLMQKHGMSNKEAEEFINSSQVQAFRDRGIEDIGLIKNAIDYTKKHDGTSYDNKRAVARAELAKNLGGDFKDNAKAQNDFMSNMKNKGYDETTSRALLNEMMEVTDV